MDTELAELADDFWAQRGRAFPLDASAFGDHTFDERVPDLDPERGAAAAQAFRDLAARARRLGDGAAGTTDERVTAALLAFEAEESAARLAEDPAAHTASPAMAGPLVAVFDVCPALTLPEGRDAAALVVRYRRLGGYFDTASRRILEGARAGTPPPAHTTRATIGWLDAYLRSPLEADPLLAPEPPAGWSEVQVEGWREAVRYAVESSVRPALQRYRDVLAHEVLPRGRPPEQAGVCWIDGGPGLYASAIRRHTTRDLDPDDLHRLGLEEIERLEDEYRALGERALGTTDLGEIHRRLREDPALRFERSAQVADAAARAVARAEEVVPAWFGTLPRTPCEVREMPAHEVEYGTIASYYPPAMDGSRPGTYYVNTHAPHTRPRFEAEALAFHEAVPGHHTQIARAQELDVPTFRRNALVTAYVEGWALYVERLADEMGLYSDDLSRLGMLSFDSWRAGRLVVDTGLHHLGWSRSEAIAYLLAHSPLAENNVVNEVDRYVVEPAQALAYKVGQRAISALRADAERRLGARFRIAGFHDAVLGHGPVPLDLLDDLVGDWVTAQAG